MASIKNMKLFDEKDQIICTISNRLLGSGSFGDVFKVEKENS